MQSGDASVNGSGEQTRSLGGLHFTYEVPEDEADLRQGDILAKTSGMATLLGEVHPYYCNDDYTHFVILTQTCDLVRRSSGVRTRYITLAAVRPLTTALARELRRYQTKILERRGVVASEAHRYRLVQFLDRVVNNNDPNYFYLHAEPARGITDNSCIFLALSIAIKADQHYETCRQARVLGLTSAFQARLGWAVGNQYSRVATEDFVGRTITRSHWKKERRRQLDELCAWFPEEQLRRAEEDAVADIENMERDEIRSHVEHVQWKSEREVIAEAAVRVFEEELGEEFDAGMKLRLMNDPDIKKRTSDKR